jgi:hypothetical protein
LVEGPNRLIYFWKRTIQDDPLPNLCPAVALLFKAALIQVSDYRLLGASGFYKNKNQKFNILSGLFQEKIPGRVGTPLIFFYLGGGRKAYFFSGGCQISFPQAHGC